MNEEEKVEEIKHRNEVKVYNLYPNNIDSNYMKILYDDIEYLLSLRQKRGRRRLPSCMSSFVK